MNEIKVGDRVHVEFEGVVDDLVGNAIYGLATVELSNGGIHRVSRDACTVIVPPIKVGDVVTAKNIGQLPRWSLIAAVGMPAWYKRDGWMLDDDDSYSDVEMLADCSANLRVLRIGGGDQ